MSKKKTDPLDRYYTPKWCVEQCLTHLVQVLFPELSTRRTKILDPCGGTGAFVEPLRTAYPKSRLTVVDIDANVGPWPGAHVSKSKTNFLDFKPRSRQDLVVGNPPFKQASAFIEHSLEISDRVVFLVRQGFLSSGRRYEFFQKYKPSDIAILPNRPGFTGPTLTPGPNATDTADYCWAVWGRDFEGDTRLLWLPLVPTRVRRGHAA